MDYIKNLIKELRYMHGLGWFGANGQAADALERLSAENTALHTKLAEVEQARDEARAELERFKKNWFSARAELEVSERAQKELRAELERVQAEAADIVQAARRMRDTSVRVRRAG